MIPHSLPNFVYVTRVMGSTNHNRIHPTMSGSSDSKSIILKTSWKYYFPHYLCSVLAIPLFGLGLIAFYLVRRKQKERSYRVTDRQISSIDSEFHRNIDLVNIQQIEIKQSWIHAKLDVGTLRLHTSAFQMELVGMEDPRKLEKILDKAIQAEQARREQQKQTKPRKPEYDPGSMEKMNYLTGLWQQGLISEEDYDREKKHLE